MSRKLVVLSSILLAGAEFAAAGAAVPPPPLESVQGQGAGGTGTVDGRAAVDRERFVDDLLARLTLEEKIGQMIQADIASISPAELGEYKLGSILAGGNAAPGNDLHSTPQAWLNMTNAYFRASAATGTTTHPAVPLLFGIDAVHGHAKVVGATIFPHNVGLGAAHDPDLVRRIGQVTAEEVAATGIDWTFAPTVAVVRDPRWGRSYESYSESPALVARYAGAMVTGLQGLWGTAEFMSPGHTLSSVKHFVGDGGTLAGRDQGNTVTSEDELLAVHAAGYPAAIEAGALIVMASYNSWNGTKLHGEHHLLTDVLKGRMGFQGFVVGDWNAHEQVPGCTKFSCAAAILAGVDMLMAPDSWKELYKNTLAQARSGAIPAARIDDAVRRILRVKALAGMFERRAPLFRPDTGHFASFGGAEHRAVAREAVRKSLVLLKNAGQVLPLDPHAHVLVAGTAAIDIGRQCGGWTVDWQGDHNTRADFPGATSVWSGIRAAIARAGGTSEYRADGRFTAKPDAAIVVFGERPYAEFEGDRETLEFSPGDKSPLALLRRLRKAGVPVVSVFLSGRPMWVNPEINASDAFVAAWLPGGEGEGIADVLFKTAGGAVAFDFTGRLAFSWPNTAMPVTFDAAGHAAGALYPEGYGLNYSEPPDSAMRLAEKPLIPPPFRAPPGSLFHAAHPTAPWSLFVADGEDQVHVTNATQDSPHGAVSVTLVPEGAAVTWAGPGAGTLRLAGRAASLERAASAGAAVVVRYRIDRAPDGEVAIDMRCTHPSCGAGGGARLDATRVFRTAPPGTWRMLRVPLACWRATGARLHDVEVPFAVETAGQFGLTLGEVRLEPRGTGPAAPCLPPVGGARR